MTRRAGSLRGTLTDRRSLAHSPVDGRHALELPGPATLVLDVNGIKLYYETYGSGTPLLLIHGNGGDILTLNGYTGGLVAGNFMFA